ncbi:unnamed protein product [Calypogeia fissa]
MPGNDGSRRRRRWMVRMKRNPAKPGGVQIAGSGEGTSVPFEIPTAGTSVASEILSKGESMENDVYEISESTNSSGSECDDHFVGKGKGKATGRQKGKVIVPKQEAAKPKTPDSIPAKRRRLAKVNLKEAVDDGSDHSSGSEFVVSQESSSSDYDSDSSYLAAQARARSKRNSRARNQRAPSHDADFVPPAPVRITEPVGRQPNGALAKSNGKGPARKGRGAKGKANLEPEKKLGWEISDDEWENVWGDATDADFDTIKAAKLPMEQRDPPKELLMPLLPFQKEWLAWSMKQEEGPMKGGILADEMGMGKTIQAISLVVAGRALTQSTPKFDLNQPLAASSSSGAQNSSDHAKVLPQVKGTLVICPLVAVIQWRNEISRFTEKGSVNVLVYHGPKRNIGLAELAKYDIILSTYSIVELEHRKHVMPPKDACPHCSRHFYPDRLRIHLKFFCGPDAQRTAKQAKQVKRKVVPGLFFEGDNEDGDDSEEDLKGMKKGKAVTTEDDDDSDEGLKGKKKGKGASNGRSTKKGKSPAARRGHKRKIGGEELSNALEGVANEVAEEKAKATSSKGNSVLHSVRWGRIILDEAHSIKDRRCSTAKGIFALQSDYKWALSGTPLQNRVGELYSLVRFLGIHPFSYYFCRKCECRSLDYQFGGPSEKCECGHSSLLHFCWWNKFVSNPIKRWGYVNDGRRAMMLLKHKVLSNILLRRTKLERAADLALPPRTAFLRRDAFDAREDDFYQALYTQSQSQFNTYVSAGTLVNNYAHIFDLLTRLRQAVDHPYLVVYSATASKEAPSFETAAGDDSCGLCHESAEDPVTTVCHHNFCRSCIQGYIDASQDLTSQCPKCQKPLTVDLIGKSGANGKDSATQRTYKRKSILNRIDLRQFQTSTKIEAVREEIYSMLQKDSAAKAIIFSQFTSMLDLIGFALEQSKIKFVKLDGSMSMAARDQMIEAFTKDADTKIFLMSLKAGGVALNLTVASHVFLMDPWWNPAVEQQAQDRIHRIGQFKPIRVIRFVIENTIEERILKLQEKKQLVFEGTVGGSSEALGRLTEEDLRFLFTS